MKLYIPVFLLSLGFLFNSSCSQEATCPEVVELGTFELQGTSSALFPYDSAQTQLVFVDSLGNEFEGKLSSIDQVFEEISSLGTCEEDPDVTITQSALAENISTTITLEDLEVWFQVLFRVDPDFQQPQSSGTSDIANILLYEGPGPSQQIATPLTQIAILIEGAPGSILPDVLTEPEPSITLAGKTFEDVYTSSGPFQNHQIYFNFEQGIVGFTDYTTGTAITYALDRVE